MAIEKSELKMAVAHELGIGFDDALEQAEQEVQKWIGAKTALADATRGIEKFLGIIALDVKAEKLTIEESNAAQAWVRKAAALCENLKLKAEVHEQRATGKVDALKSVIGITKKLYDKEKSKSEALREGQDADEELVNLDGRRPPARPTGARPPNVIASKRAAEKAE